MVVNDFSLFLNEIFDDLHGLDGKITPKFDRLCYTKHLRLAGLGPPCDAKWTIVTLLEKGDWSGIAESKAGRQKRIRLQGIKELEDLISSLSEAVVDGEMILPKLETVVYGQRAACGWRHLMLNHFLPRRYLDSVMRAAQLLSEFIDSCHPQSVCLHNFFGPYGVAPAGLNGLPNKTVFTVHHHDYYHFEAPFFADAPNVHLLEPGVNRVYDGTFYGEANGVQDLESTVAKLEFIESGSRGDRIFKNFSISLYGHFDPFIHEQLEEADRQSASEGTCGMRARRRLEEKRCREEILGEIMGSVSTAWRSRMAFLPAEESPCCRACGWTVQDGWHD